MTTCIKVFLKTLAFLTLLSIAKAEIFITNSSLTPWTGSCLDNCPFNAPCSVTSVQAHSFNGPCEITFLEGFYTNPLLTWFIYDENVTITIEGKVTGLQITIAQANNILLKGRHGGYLDQTFLTSKVNVTNSAFQISNLTFWDSGIIHSGRMSVMEISNCAFYIDSTEASIYHYGPIEIPILLSNVSFGMALGSGRPLFSVIRSEGNVSVSATNISGTIPSLVVLPSDFGRTLRVEIFNSRLEVFRSLADVGFDLRIVQSEISSYGRNTSLTANAFRSVLIERSTLTGFYLAQNLGHGNLTILDSQLFGCRFATDDLNPIQIFKSQYIMNDSSSFFIFVARSEPERPTTKLLLSEVEFWVEDENIPFGPLSFTGQVILREGSSFKTNMLWVAGGSSLSVDFLTVTALISHRNSAPAPLLTATNPAVAVWHFNSIHIDNMVVDLLAVKELHYHATLPLKGITCSGNYPLITAPERIFVSWENESIPIQAGTWYPLGAPFVELPRHIIPAASSAQSGLEIFSRISNASAIVSFRYDIAIPCAPPPVGFICVHGIWVTNGTTTPPQTVVIPGNTGVVQIEGNLTVSGPIVFEGTGTILNVTGCLSAPSVEIQIKGKGDNLPSGPVTFIQQQGDGCNSLIDIPLNVIQDEKACKKVSVTKETKASTSSSLVVVFAVDSSRCSSKSWRWIVLGCVLGAVVLTAALSILIWRSVSSKYTAASTKKKLGVLQ